jgi:tRNA pseudouridine13 synthase
MERDEAIESPRKRLKTDDASAPDTIAAPAASQGAERPDLPVNPLTGLKEAEVGILEFVSTDVSGFEGILKKRLVDSRIFKSHQVPNMDHQDTPTSWSTKFFHRVKFFTSATRNPRLL